MGGRGRDKGIKRDERQKRDRDGEKDLVELMAK